jgi:RNA polymerase sigma-70 factor (ECF subfamily)
MADTELVEQFIRIVASHEARLRCYVLSLVPRWADADEIMQEVNVVLWQKFEQFQPDSNFFAWACQIARFKVKDYRRKKSRERVIFSDALVEMLADECVAVAEKVNDSQTALDCCLRKLNPDQRKLILLRYNEDTSIHQIAMSLGRTVGAIYKALERTHQLLHECIRRRLEGASA